MIRIPLFLLVYSNVYAQFDTTKVKITNVSTYEYVEKAEMECDHDYENEIKVDKDTISVYSDVTETSCIIVNTGDKKLDKFINESLTHCSEKSGFGKKISWTYQCISDKPGESYSYQVMNYFSSKYISLTNFTRAYACCGANGSSEDADPITVDLISKKYLVLKDILNVKYDEEIYDTIISNIKKTDSYLFGEFGETNNPILFHKTSILDYTFAIKKDGIIIFFGLDRGCCHYYTEINFPYKTYSKIFKIKFLRAIKD